MTKYIYSGYYHLFDSEIYSFGLTLSELLHL